MITPDIVLDKLQRNYVASQHPVGSMCTATWEYFDVNSEELCCFQVSESPVKEAQVVFFDNGHVASVFVVCEDPEFRREVAETIFSTDEDEE
jgi:hypothetical protein